MKKSHFSTASSCRFLGKPRAAYMPPTDFGNTTMDEITSDQERLFLGRIYNDGLIYFFKVHHRSA